MHAQHTAVIKKRHIVSLTAVLSILFILGGYLYYRYQEEDIRRHNHRVLSTTGEIKANQLAWWYEDELYDAAVFSQNPLFRRFVNEWLTSGSIADRTNLIDLLDVTADSHSYENILITDPRGELLLSFIPDIVAIDSIVVSTVRRAANELEIISTDLYKSSIHQEIYIDFIAPVVDDQEEPIAVLVLRLDPNQYLYPFIQSWPVPTETAESIIFRREDDTALFLNELRHKDDAVLRLRLPLTQTDLPAVQAVLGYEGIFTGKDYRGVDVLADVRFIPGTPWFIVAKIDKREIFSELYFRAGVIISFVFLLILLLGAGLAFIYSNRQRNLYRELYNTERELWESQEEFKTTLYSIGDAVIITDTAGTIRNMNPTAERLSGWLESDAHGKPLDKVFRIINEETRRPVDNPVQKVLREGHVVGLANHTILISKEEKEIPIADSGAPIRDKAGEIIGVVLVFRDQTAERVAANKLRESEEQFRLIAENIPDMIVVLDTGGRRIYNNPSYEAILGDPTALVGTDSFQEIHPEDRGKIKHIFEESVKAGAGQQTEFRLLSKDGDVRIIESKGGVIQDEQGKVSQVVVVSRDVTEKKKLEEQMLRTQRMESIGLLAGGIAHDLNNVLAPIMLSLNIIKKKVTDKKTAKLLETVEASAQRGADLIKQVLLFSRGLEGEHTPVQIRHIIDEVEKVIKQTFPKSISLKIDAPKDLRHIPADVTQIHQVLMNLCINARDAMPDGGTLEIGAKNITIDEQYTKMNIEAKPGTYVQVTVSDTGAGIPPEIIGKIFDPFFTTKEQGKGTGLGLSTVYSIIKSHGGFVNVYSEEGRGTIFKVYLPAKETEEDVIMKEKYKVPGGNGELILVVDDEKAVRAITQTTLEANGYKVLTAADGVEAVALYEEHRQDIDLILMDLTMPNMDGYAAIRAIKKRNPKTLVVVMSGLVQNEKLVKEDFVEFLHKPFTAESMLLTIYEMLKIRK